jgi:hypothetical protein
MILTNYVAQETDSTNNKLCKYKWVQQDAQI